MKTARNSVKYQASFSAFFKKLAILFEMADYMISIFLSAQEYRLCIWLDKEPCNIL